MLRLQSTLIGGSVILTLLVQTALGGNWQVSESEDPMDGTKTVVASTDADRPVTVGTLKYHPKLFVRCLVSKDQTQRNLYFAVDLQSSLLTHGSRTPVRWRFDNGSLHREIWLSSENRESVFAANAAKMAEELIFRKIFHFEVKPKYRNTKYMKFDLTGSAKAIRRVWSACFPGVPLKEPSRAI